MDKFDFNKPIHATLFFEESDDENSQSTEVTKNISEKQSQKKHYSYSPTYPEESTTNPEDVTQTNYVTPSPTSNVATTSVSNEDSYTNKKEEVKTKIAKRKSPNNKSKGTKIRKREEQRAKSLINKENAQDKTVPEYCSSSGRNHLLKSDKTSKHKNNDDELMLQKCLEIYSDLIACVCENLVSVLIGIKRLQSKLRKIDDVKLMEEYVAKVKIHYFGLSYTTVTTIFEPRKYSALFRNYVIEKTIEIAKKKYLECSCKDIEPLYHELITWANLKKKLIVEFHNSIVDKNKQGTSNQPLSPYYSEIRTSGNGASLSSNCANSVNKLSTELSTSDASIINTVSSIGSNCLNSVQCSNAELQNSDAHNSVAKNNNTRHMVDQTISRPDNITNSKVIWSSAEITTLNANCTSTVPYYVQHTNSYDFIQNQLNSPIQPNVEDPTHMHNPTQQPSSTNQTNINYYLKPGPVNFMPSYSQNNQSNSGGNSSGQTLHLPPLTYPKHLICGNNTALTFNQIQQSPPLHYLSIQGQKSHMLPSNQALSSILENALSLNNSPSMYPTKLNDNSQGQIQIQIDKGNQSQQRQASNIQYRTDHIPNQIYNDDLNYNIYNRVDNNFQSLEKQPIYSSSEQWPDLSTLLNCSDNAYCQSGKCDSYQPTESNIDKQQEARKSLSRDSGFISPAYCNTNNTEMFNIPEENGRPSEFMPVITHVTSLNPSAIPLSHGNCIVCGAKTRDRCLRCYVNHYCSYECQARDWKQHYPVCSIWAKEHSNKA